MSGQQGCTCGRGPYTTSGGGRYGERDCGGDLGGEPCRPLPLAAPLLGDSPSFPPFPPPGTDRRVDRVLRSGEVGAEPGALAAPLPRAPGGPRNPRNEVVERESEERLGLLARRCASSATASAIVMTGLGAGAGMAAGVWAWAWFWARAWFWAWA